MERDGNRDVTHLFADLHSFRPVTNNDDPGTGWMSAGLVRASGIISFSRTVSRASLPRESGREEWYLVAAVTPDVFADLALTLPDDEISLNIG